MDLIGKIRHMYSRKKKSIREISRQTGLSRNTITKWVKDDVDVQAQRQYNRPRVAGKLTPFVQAIEQALKADAFRAKKYRRTARTLFKQIQGDGYEGGYTRLTDFIRQWRMQQGQSGAGKAFVPLSFEMGEAFQFDWSEEGLLIAGIYRKLQVAHMKLCASRAFWLIAYPSQGHEMLFDAHTNGFAALGGIATRGIYDNMKTAVDEVPRNKSGQRTKERVVNARFTAMCAHYLFEPDFCNVASGWEKGIVEKNVQDSRRHIWSEALARRWSSLAELNAWLGMRCREVWQQSRHPEQRDFSVAEMLELERQHLMPMPAPFDGYVEEMARVSSTCLVTLQRNRYSVPCELVGQMVSTRLYPTRIQVVADGVVVAEHERQKDKGKTIYDWQHYILLLQRKPGALRNGAPFADLPEPLQRLRRALLRQSGGDRLMAKVLALVPGNGLQDVLVAVELALEAAPPSGRVSQEHVINVLARLNAPQRPANVNTTLQALTPPIADTARYDRLRCLQEVTHDNE